MDLERPKDLGRSDTVAAPWLSPLSYWIPDHVVTSAWLGHGAFASWLIGAHRPRTLLELGTHNGFSYFAFREAARRLGHPLESWAVDSWEGDEHAGFYDGTVLQGVEEVNAGYGDSSHLVRGYFADVVDRFDDGSIDLLHIDGRHRYEDAKEDYELYAPKLSERGIVLFHDIAILDRGFGVHRFWAELQGTAPSLSFQHSAGLGVLFAGAERTPEVEAFVAAAQRDPDAIRADYERLGGRIEELQGDRERLADAARRTEIAEAAAARLVGVDQQLDAVHRSTSWRVTAPLRRLRRPRG